MTLRDQLWDEILRTLCEVDSFRLSDLPFDGSQRYTARRVLRDMEDRGWLSREHERALDWHPGELAEKHLLLAEKS